MPLSRRRFLLLGAALPLVTAFAAPGEPDVESLRRLLRPGIQRAPDGTVTAVFGLAPATADEVLQRATKADALPDGYSPADISNVAAAGIPAAGRQLLRSIILDDTRALIDSATGEGLDVYVGSGFRSQSYQAAVFAAQIKRWGNADTANRYSAMPGHSQHQLGTTIDFTDTFGAFRQSPAADWLRDNAHQFGFLLPYTASAVPLTGYVDEPWHGRWVGSQLAGFLQSLGYQQWTNLDADDAVSLVRTEAGLDA